ncbi:MAG: alpha/beta fold hydrolase, partial [Pseudomonadota bacterium]
EAGKYWASAGLTTVAYDQRGFGRNTSRSFWPGADGLIADLKSVARDLRRKHPCKPLILLGHSMGGGVTLAASPELDVDGLILAAPAIWGGEELNPFHRLAAWIAATAVPDTRFTGEGVVRIQASDNIEMLRELGRDPLYLRPPSAREIWGLVRITDMAEAASIDMRVPALLLLGEKDQIVPKRAVRRVFNQGDGPRQVVVYPEGWHLLFRDLQAETVWEDVANWIAKVPRPSSCDQPAG